ncbi:MAG TPA: triose-phosphate isomerase [Spirochaetota bacterium]|nr:triose-phosphate isomerase [Spirochaetota bacterium]HQO01242.1 triose-phosphate isomerase [Spirochaetota bacterium]
MSRRKIFAGNWKMYTTRGEAGSLIESIRKGLGDAGDKEVLVFPPAVHLGYVVELAKGAIAVGAQNMYFEENGAFTGEISPVMVKDSGARYILIGHSERRHVFGETDEMVNRKVHAAYSHSLEPVVCVGELLEERESGKSESVVKRQITEGLAGITGEQMKKMVVAYEPVWAIGTGKVATPEIAESMHRYIRGVLADLYGGETAGTVPLLYGGSVKPDNIAGLYAVEDIDGVLVGGASLKADSFLDIIHGA